MQTLSEEQRITFFEDGYIVFRDIIPHRLVREARRLFYKRLGSVWHQSMGLANQYAQARQNDTTVSESSIQEWVNKTMTSARTGSQPEIREVVAETGNLRKTINNTLGSPAFGFQFAQAAFLFPTEPSDHITESGYPDREVPFLGWHGHLDGLWNGATAPHQNIQRPMTKEQREVWSQPRGRNGVPRTFKGKNANITNFTALLGIPLSDQSTEGVGNVGLLRGAHHYIEQFFTEQREQGGPLGPDGPGWKRIHQEAPNKSGLRHYPEQVRKQFRKDAEFTNDGRMWPKPDLIRMNLGDALLTLHAIPHGATRCEGMEPRLMLYFRLVAGSRSDDDRRVFPDALCDCWLEWEGMYDTVKQLRSKPLRSLIDI